MSLAEDDFISSGRFEAEVLREIVNGREPGSLPQIYVSPLTVALNYRTAKAIGWDPPFELLAVIDELYVDDWSGQSGPAPVAAESEAIQ
jgi:hypothetical protein